MTYEGLREVWQLVGRLHFANPRLASEFSSTMGGFSSQREALKEDERNSEEIARKLAEQLNALIEKYPQLQAEGGD